MKRMLLSFAVLVCSQMVQAQKKEIVFSVIFKKDKIGTVTAVQEKQGAKVINDLKTNTDAKVFMISVHVESELHVIKENGTLVQGTAYRHANRGSEDVHAKVVRLAEKTYQAEKNGKTNKIENQPINFCVADLYFQEPLGLNSIFSNMYASFLTIKAMGSGKYQVITPDKKNTYYTYQNGQLITMESDTPLGKVVSKRI
jgi:hypothetical protein